LGRTVEALDYARGRVRGARVRGPRGPERVEADWFVCALPVEKARRLFTRAMRQADPRLARADALRTEWMSGIQYFLRERVDILPGTVGYIDSPWLVSSVSLAQFWADPDGSAQSCLAAVPGNWRSPGALYGKSARELDPGRIAREIWEQMKAHLNDTGSEVLRDDMIARWHLDPAISFRRTSDGRRKLTSREPLFVTTKGAWYDRPEAATAIPNLALAGDWVRASFDPTGMECANEQAGG
jgi:uncharacterized protein with NAD-binding domain and iron-sulfur cluster